MHYMSDKSKAISTKEGIIPSQGGEAFEAQGGKTKPPAAFGMKAVN